MKRDISLLERVHARQGDELTVLDISLKVNAAALIRALDSGARVRYFDHHAHGDIPQHPALEAHVDTAPDTCTSLIVDRHLGGRYRMWAVVAAFGDNLVNAAVRAAQPLGLDPTERARLHELGECLNYNAYGDSVDDLHYHPADLYRTIARYADPRHFIYDEPVFHVLKTAYSDDLSRAHGLSPHWASDAAALYVLPDAAWSRRVSGLYINRVAQSETPRAHAVLIAKAGGFSVSVRAPLERPRGADSVCQQFDSGGGRQGAAGINFLPESDLDRFMRAFQAEYDHE